jgi:hypothetical protein
MCLILSNFLARFMVTKFTFLILICLCIDVISDFGPFVDDIQLYILSMYLITGNVIVFFSICKFLSYTFQCSQEQPVYHVCLVSLCTTLTVTASDGTRGNSFGNFF